MHKTDAQYDPVLRTWFEAVIMTVSTQMYSLVLNDLVFKQYSIKKHFVQKNAWFLQILKL